MKSINDKVAPSTIASLYLEGRRDYSNLDTGDLKRTERRRARHALKQRMHVEVQLGLEAQKALDLDSQQDAKAFERANSHYMRLENGQLLELPVQFVARTPVIREVTVIRKRAFKRALVETLQVAL